MTKEPILQEAPLPKVFSVMGSLIIPPAPFRKGVELQGIAVKVPLLKRGT
jgi:hypothetical protein